MNLPNRWASLSSAMPIPVSSMVNLNMGSVEFCAGPSMPIKTWPRFVNLMELPARLTRICRILPGSPITRRGASGAYPRIKSIPFSAARGASSSATSSTATPRSKRIGSMVILPASILEKSRMSLMMVSSASAD